MKENMLEKNAIDNVPQREKEFFETFITAFMKKEVKETTFNDIVEFDMSNKSTARNTALYNRVMKTVKNLIPQKQVPA